MLTNQPPTVETGKTNKREAIEEKNERLAQAIETLENLQFALQMLMSADLHVEQLRAALPDLVAEMKAGFIESTGENPWVDLTDEPDTSPGRTDGPLDQHEPLD